jgi:hypothetical protein
MSYGIDGEDIDFLDTNGDGVRDFWDIRQWISPRNWIRLYGAFIGASVRYPTAGGGGPQTRYPHILVRGRFVDGAGWELLPAYELEMLPLAPREAPDYPFKLELYDGLGQSLLVHAFDLPDQHSDGDHSLPPSFVEFVPDPGGVETIFLTEDGATVALLQRSAGVPSVSLGPIPDFTLGPEPVLLTWSASDPESEQLFFMVQIATGYAGDGEPDWRAVAMDILEPEVPIPSHLIRGSEEARLRILATDGFNTAVAESGLFTIPGKAPIPVILSPVDYVLIEKGSPLHLIGTATDLEDGLIPDDRLHWTSSVDGFIGTGRRVTAEHLSAGAHEITLTAVDSDFMFGSASILVDVNETINIQPVADAGPDIRVRAGTWAPLEGKGSHDENGDALSYRWSEVPESPSMLVWPDREERSSFLSFAEGLYEVELVVHDGEVLSVPDRISVEVVSWESGLRVSNAEIPACGGVPQDSLAPVASPQYVILDAAEAIDGLICTLEWSPSDKLEVVEARPGPDLPAGVEFFEVQIESGGLGQGEAIVRLNLAKGSLIGPGSGLRVLEIYSRSRPAAAVGDQVSVDIAFEVGERFQHPWLLVREPETRQIVPTRGGGKVRFTADTTPPTIACRDIVLHGTSGGAYVTLDIEAEDDCGVMGLSFVPPSGSFFPEGTTEVLCTATDWSSNTSACSFHVTVLPPPTFRRGDCNCDGFFDISDALFNLRFLFGAPSGIPPCCHDACDSDDDGILSITDAIVDLGRLFLGGGPLPQPYPGCGPDPSAPSGLEVCSYPDHLCE